jgi:hypothetical protein
VRPHVLPPGTKSVGLPAAAWLIPSNSHILVRDSLVTPGHETILTTPRVNSLVVIAWPVWEAEVVPFFLGEIVEDSGTCPGDEELQIGGDFPYSRCPVS